MVESDPLENKSVLVTGGASGIGRASAYALARDGADITIADIHVDEVKSFANKLTSEFGTDTLVRRVDVRDEDQVEELVRQTVDRFGKLDILASIAGLVEGEPNIEDLATEDYRIMMQTNVDGLFFSTRAAIPFLKETKGNIIFIGSFAGCYPRPSHAVYSATKWWTRGFAKSVQANVGNDGIGVTSVNPSSVRTKFGPGETEFQKEFEKGEKAEPDEIAEAVTLAAQYTNSTIEEINVFSRQKYTDW